MSEVSTMQADRGVMVGEHLISWSNCDFKMAFVPPMNNKELDEVRALNLSNGFKIIHEEQRGQVSVPGTPNKIMATILEIRSQDSGVQGHYAQLKEGAAAHAERIPAAVGALTKWWMDKSNPDPEDHRLSVV